MKSDDDARRRDLDAVARAFEAVGRGDVDAQLAEYTDDAVMEFPFSDPPAALEGKQAIRTMLLAAFSVIEITLEVTDIHECVDPDRAVVEFHSTGRITTTGKPYVNRYVNIFEFEDGRIRRQREYLNPIPYVEAMQPGAEAMRPER